MTFSGFRVQAATIAFAIAALTPQVASAQQGSERFAQDEFRDDEIIVTAQRREESIQDVPVSITAVKGSDLDTQLVRDIRDLAASVPSFVVSTANGGLDFDFAIRGISSTAAAGGSGAVAFHRDGIYQATSAAAFGEYFDIDRIEILRGPQGTLFGRNSTAGAINVISAKAEQGFSAGGDIQFGDYNLRRFKGFVNASLNDSVFVRIAGQLSKRDGYQNNLAGPDLDDLDEYALRPQIVVRPSDAFELQVTGEFFRNRSRGVGTRPLITTSELYAVPLVVPGIGAFPSIFAFAGASPISTDLRTVSVDVTDQTRIRYDRDAVTAVATGDLGFAELKVTAGYVKNDQERGFDADGTDALIVRAEQFFKSEQLSIEAQLASTGTGPFSWIVGVYKLNNDSSGRIPVSLIFNSRTNVPLSSSPPLPFNFFPLFRGTGGNVFNKNDLSSFAVFGQASYDFSDQFRATLGLRHTTDNIAAVYSQAPYPILGPLAPTRNEASYKEVTGRGALEFRPNDDLLFFVQASRGFNQTGFNAVSNVGPVPVTPEILWAYEGGVKSTVFGGSGTVNASIFYNDYTNLNQTQVVGATSITDVGDAQVLGAELETSIRPFSGLTLTATVSYLDSKYKNFVFTNPVTSATVVLDGNRLTRAPKWQGSLGAQYRADLGGDFAITPRIDVFWQSKVFFRADNNPLLVGNSYTKTDATLRLDTPFAGAFLEAFVENLENDQQITNISASFAQIGGFPLATFSAPRTWGVRAGFRF